MLPIKIEWASCIDGMVREKSMDVDPTVNYLVFAPWKHTSNSNRGVVVSMCKYEV